VLTFEYSVYQLPQTRTMPLVREVWRTEDFLRAVDLLTKWGEAPRRLFVPRAARRGSSRERGL
jgi:hypothetical protein